MTQIERAIDAELYYSALAVAFTLPDVCSSLEADPSQPYWATKDKYTTWFDRNVSRQFSNVTGNDCYFMRGGVVHRGQFSHQKSKFDRIIFVLPGSPIYGHDAIIALDANVTLGGKSREEATGAPVGRAPTGNVLLLDAVRFCRIFVDAVCQWSLRQLDSDNFRTNVGNLVHLRQDGIPPLIVGVPVIG